MRILLKEKILNLGTVGDHVDVRSGYARNFLIPQGKAMAVNQENLAEFEKIRKDLEANESEKLALAQKRADILKKQAIVFESKVREGDQIFGSITVSEIVDMYVKHGHEVLRSELKIIDGPVKSLGEYGYLLQVHPDLSLQLKFKVVSDQPIEEQTKSTKKNATVTPEKVEPAQEADAEIKDVDGDDEV
ncbi:MAG: 50S ribosomal protein L9 [Gammaproteobacteria bacterium]|nr:50S ribosomal protein L9 [Gammaproteobacteria bacterium]